MSDWILSPRAQAALLRVDQALLDVTAARGEMQDVTRHLIVRGGKRMRPALLLVAADFGDGPCESDAERLIAAALVVELMHVASLYHDDVIDRAPLRRGVSTVNRRWGNSLATVGGTFLIARALELAAGLGDAANKAANDAVAALCGGELQEIESAFDIDLPEETHLEILSRKTATLFRLPCALAAIISRMSAETARALDAYATAVGLAFQLADDALDLVSRTRVLGKRAGADLREGIYSLPVLRAVCGGGAEAKELRELLARETMTDRELGAALRRIRRSGAVELARRTAHEYVDRALAAIAPLPRGTAAESLARLATLAVERAT